MKQYSDELPTILGRSGVAATSFGAPITIKPIPDCDKGGVLDARELNITLEAMKSGRVPKSYQDIREDTGYPNRNLNTVEIITDCICLDVFSRRVRLWIYTPRKPFNRKDRACMMYIHGGSYFAGSPFVSENACRLLAEKADCVVVNVEFSLAPELPYPNGYKDCIFALEYIRAHSAELGIDPSKLCIGGDSSGATVAAAIALHDEGRDIKYMALFYPSVTVDLEHVPFEWKESDFEVASEQAAYIIPRLRLGRTDGRGDMLLMQMIGGMYLQHGEDVRDSRISPIYADLSRAPRTLILTSEFDGLRPLGEYFAARLREAGGDVRTIRYRGVHHAFIDKLGLLPQGEDAIAEIAKDMIKL